MRHFLRHLAEMIIAMVVGMVVLAPFWPLPTDRPDVASFVMATNMSVAMAVWMWHRGHSARATAEMTAAMYASFLVFLIPWWAGLLPPAAVLTGGHVLMVPAMILTMLHRRAEYTAPHPAVERTGLLARWPTVLAVLMTIDVIVEPQSMAPWTLLVLAFAYVAIGAVRGTLRPRRTLVVQVAALVAYLVLLAAALTAGPVLSVVLVGSGWLAHAGWDLWHHRHNAVVPRAFAEWCGVLDAITGISVLTYAATL
ncbi:hypothetical protein [Actinoplanes friuliensis]|uniref:Uncharacterized protein n=1 Tax=Actinoplanes friuliensis DSM 7358 TaxID=1246995 RepID=U5W1F8_9ACTN|nr:hypothetical protein [Actinoplanes friuliensis]AGZ41810.1 hypothetical protein AFR_17660 [Actinoplanes friuliensis DSM 7358]